MSTSGSLLYFDRHTYSIYDIHLPFHILFIWHDTTYSSQYGTLWFHLSSTHNIGIPPSFLWFFASGGIDTPSNVASSKLAVSLRMLFPVLADLIDLIDFVPCVGETVL